MLIRNHCCEFYEWKTLLYTTILTILDSVGGELQPKGVQCQPFEYLVCGWVGNGLVIGGMDIV